MRRSESLSTHLPLPKRKRQTQHMNKAKHQKVLTHIWIWEAGGVRIAAPIIYCIWLHKKGYGYKCLALYLPLQWRFVISTVLVVADISILPTKPTDMDSLSSILLASQQQIRIGVLLYEERAFGRLLMGNALYWRNFPRIWTTTCRTNLCHRSGACADESAFKGVFRFILLALPLAHQQEHSC